MKSGYLKYFTWAFAALLVMQLTGCIFENSAPEPVDPADKPNPNEVILCLNVEVPKAGASRADDPDGYEGPEGDFEKIRTLRVIIVNNLDAENNTGFVEANRLVRTDNQGNPMYDNLNFVVQADQMKRIYLLANEEFLASPVTSMTASVFLDNFKVNSVKSVDLSPLSNWTVSLPGINVATETVTSGLFSPPSPTSSSTTVTTRLPLTESFDIYVKRESALEDISHANLFLTRAAAKASFFLTAGNNYGQGGASAATTITAITLAGVGTSEYVFPHNSEYSPAKYTKDSDGHVIVNPADNNERYINDFDLPPNWRPVTYSLSQLSFSVTPVTMRPINSVPIYFPETILDPNKHYVVGVQINGDTWLTAPLTNVLTIDGENSSRDAIARDTHLKIEIKFESTGEIIATVLPWDREDYYIDYTANIGFASDNDYLTFSNISDGSGTSSGLFLDKESAQLVIDYGKEAAGSFYISSPAGATWDAYLITTGGVTDAIQFAINDPTNPNNTIYTTHLSGKVGEDKATFGIAGTVNPGTEQNTAQLLVIVTLADGTPVIANVIEAWRTSAQRLTIISQ